MVSNHDFRAALFANIIITIFIWTPSLSHAAQSDIDCLRAVKASLRDPSNYLTSWNFTNGTQTSICGFTGIECSHDDDNSILKIELSGMGLEGEFPLGFADCTAMTGLDLSSNKLHGPIPKKISHFTASGITVLDLSYNQFSGHIPENLANCTYLNTLRLDNNRLTGHIPQQLGLLWLINVFDVSNNQLSGPVPEFVNNPRIEADSYANNAGLCGGPFFPGCPDPILTDRTVAFIGAAVGCFLGFVIGFWWCISRQDENKNNNNKKKKKQYPNNKLSKSLEVAKRVKLSMFEKIWVSELSLYDLMKATNNFSNRNIIGTGGTGTTYKAVLQNGTSLMVKRLQGHTQHSEKKLISEMTTLGNCKHRNLVPLIGFCWTRKERFLVYKHIPNGTLHDKLHVSLQIMDWPVRLKIATGAAKGLAWLHRTILVHWNISSKFVLLDVDYEPKIFVPAGLLTNQTRLGRVANNSGRVVPVYARTTEGDVYSFGVILLELVTRVKPTIEVDLVEWISQLSSKSDLGEAVDGFLVGKGFDSEISRVLEVACSCVLPGRRERPTMFEVHKLLKGIARHKDEISVDDV